jgi:multiple sugar transport system substrate-binding protein
MSGTRYRLPAPALAMVLALAACTGAETSPSAAESEAPIASGASPSASEMAAYEGPLEWWHLGYTPGGETPTSQLVDDAVAAYEADNPGIDITVTGIPFSDEGLAQLDTALATDEGPDIFRIASDRLPNYGEQGVLSPIDDYLTDEDRSDILPNLLDGVEFNGEHLAWPQWVPPIGFYLNNAVFEAAGVEIPDETWTVDEFKQIAQDVTGDGVFGFATYMGAASVNELTLLYTEGAIVLSDDNAEYTLGSEAGVAGLQTLVDLFEAGAMPPDSTTIALPDVEQGFIDGRFAMMTNGSGSIANLVGNEVEFTVLPPPIGGAGETVTVGGMGTYAVPAKSDPARVAAAHDLARYLTGQVIEDVPGWFLAPATRQSIDVAADNPDMQPFQDMLPAVRFMPLIPAWPEIDALIHPEIQLAVAGQKSPQQALDDAGAQITPLLGE